MSNIGNVYIADTGHHRIRKVTVSTGIISTIAGDGATGYSGDNAAATSVSLYYPYDIKLDASGGYYYYYFCCTVRCILHTWRLFSRPFIHNFLFNIGNVYIADANNFRIRKVTVSTGIITTIAGTGSYGYSGDNGDATSAALGSPEGVALDASGRITIIIIYCAVCYKLFCALGDPILSYY